MIASFIGELIGNSNSALYLVMFFSVTFIIRLCGTSRVKISDGNLAQYLKQIFIFFVN